MNERHPDCHCPRAVHHHGSRTTYIIHACRCDACREDNTVQARKRRKAQLYGRYHLVDAEPARQHALHLMAQGMGSKRIATAAGLHNSVISVLLWGKHLDKPDHPEHRPPRKQIRKEHAEALLAVELDLADAAFVPALGIARRIRALHAAGWPLSDIARRLGILQSNLTPLHTDPRPVRRRRKDDRTGVQAINRNGAKWTVTKATADAVAKLYDELVDLDAAEHVTTIGHSRALNSSKRRGWHPPAAWDAESIDNPHAEPMPTDPESVRLREQARRRIRPSYRDYQLRRAA